MKYLTTGQAAKVLMVTRDTVLKWIKQGKLSAIRTAGGHFRIPSDSLGVPASAKPESVEISASPPEQPQYCWEYFASNTKVKEECLSCLVYKVRGTKCYEVGEFLRKLGFGSTCCPTSCAACTYYKDQVRQKSKVLIFTTDGALRNKLAEQAKSSRLELQFSCWEYDCAFVIGSFAPEYVIVDCPEKKDVEKYRILCDHIRNDPRVPNLQLLLAVSKERKKNHDFQDDITVITRPFTVDEIHDHLRKLEVHRAKERWNLLVQQEKNPAKELVSSTRP